MGKRHAERSCGLGGCDLIHSDLNTQDFSQHRAAELQFHPGARISSSSVMRAERADFLEVAQKEK